MDPKVVVIVTWFVAGLVVAAYIWFVVWRFRVDRRKKQAQEVEDLAMSAAIARTAERIDRAPDTAAAAAAPSSPAGAVSKPVLDPDRAPLPTRTPASAPAPMRSPAPEGAAPAATVADRVKGISLPHDLVPLTTMTPRMAAGDRVAFWTDRAPAEIVGPAFADELERLGYEITTLDVQSLAAKRNDDHLMVVIHPDGPAANVDGHQAFSSVPENSVVIEVWIPG